MIETIVFIFGICIGSFLNVCIYRLPAGKSIVHPPSSCPECSAGIHFYDNIPVLSYFILRGRCRNCGAPIAFRYVLVELLGGGMAVCTYIRFGFGIESIVYYLFIAALIVVIFIDIDHQIIPDVISLPGIPIGLGASFLIPDLGYLDSILGILAGGGALYVIARGYMMIKGIEGMGLGDVKLLAMIGALLGWKKVLLTIILSSFTGTLVGLAVMIKEKKGMKTRIPFGPFLAIGAIICIFFGNEIISCYKTSGYHLIYTLDCIYDKFFN